MYNVLLYQRLRYGESPYCDLKFIILSLSMHIAASSLTAVPHYFSSSSHLLMVLAFNALALQLAMQDTDAEKLSGWREKVIS
jgi:hypothetical protein